MNARAHVRRVARSNIGRRCSWRGETVAGRIIDVEYAHGGWPQYVIEWEPDAPEWWSARVSAATSMLELGEPEE